MEYKQGDKLGQFFSRHITHNKYTLEEDIQPTCSCNVVIVIVTNGILTNGCLKTKWLCAIFPEEFYNEVLHVGIE